MVDGIIIGAAVLVAAFFIIQPELARIGAALWDIQTELETLNHRNATAAAAVRASAKAARPDLFPSHRPTSNENLAPAALDLLQKLEKR